MRETARRLLLPALLLTAPAAAPAPLPAQTGAIRGVALDPAGEPVYAASVEAWRRADPERRWATSTGRDGRFVIEGLPAGRYRLRVTRIGYAAAERTVDVPADGVARVEVALEEAAVEARGVEVEAERAGARTDATPGATVHEIDAPELELLPGLAETDVLRAVAVLPGVVSTSDYTSAFNVRGGSADQNLILLDGVPIFNPFHLGGLFSVFNSDMVQRAELLAGGFPARFGGRVSSVLRVESDPGVGAGVRGDGAISLLATRLALAGDLPDAAREPLGLRSARWRVSARRSYFDQLFKPFFDFPYHLTDVQAYGEVWTGRGGRISVTGYTGDDVLDFRRLDPDDFPLRLHWRWGNDLAGLRWTKPVGDGGLAELRASHTRFSNAIRFPDFDDTRLDSRIEQTMLAAELDWSAASTLDLATGLHAARLEYANRAESGGTSFRQGEDEGWHGAAFARASWRPAADWLVGAGVRADGWRPRSGADLLVASPRLSVQRTLGAGDEGAVTLSLGRYSQFLHSLRDEQLPIGIDVWVTAGRRAPHIVSDQAQAGIEWEWDSGWHGSLEAYHRSFDGVVTNNFAQDPNEPLDDLLVGRGRSYGADLMVGRRAEDGLTGWATVSWLRATRTFPDEASGASPPPEIRYPPVFDRRLDVDLVLRWALPWDVRAGLRWNLGTGLPYTEPAGAYTYFEHHVVESGGLEPQFGAPPAVLLGARNGSRYPAYRRLDVSARRAFERGWGTLTPYLSVVNILNRRNVLFYFHQYDRDPPVRTGVSMFPVLPTFGMEVSF